MSISYISQCLLRAELSLVAGLGSIQERLCSAGNHLQSIHQPEMDTAPSLENFRERFKKLRHSLFEPGDGSDAKRIKEEGSVKVATEQLDDLEAIELAKEISALAHLSTELYEAELKRQKRRMARKK